MFRRRFLFSMLAGFGTASRANAAQPTAKLPRVGYVQEPFPSAIPVRAAFLEGLRDRGWTDGRTVTIDWRQSNDEIPALVRLNVDVLVLPNPYRVEAGLTQTKTIPIVTVDLESDPVAKGWIRSLARPGGNLTGIWLDFPDLAGKQLQLLAEAVPTARRVAVVWDDRIAALQFAATEAAARRMDIATQSAPIRHEHEADQVVRQALAARPQAILMLTSPIVFRAQRRIAELALQHRLPTVSGFSTLPDDGGLLAYGPNFPAMWQQMASYVDRILRGAKPGELPVERPARFELRINAKTAHVLGRTIPPSLRARADELIE